MKYLIGIMLIIGGLILGISIGRMSKQGLPKADRCVCVSEIDE